jgi:hypothetical protein
MLHEGHYSLDVFTMTMCQEAQTFARAIRRRAHPNMIKVTQSQPVYGETAAANGARDFLEGVIRFLGTAGQAKDPSAGGIGRVNQANQPLRRSFFGH